MTGDLLEQLVKMALECFDWTQVFSVTWILDEEGTTTQDCVYMCHIYYAKNILSLYTCKSNWNGRGIIITFVGTGVHSMLKWHLYHFTGVIYICQWHLMMIAMQRKLYFQVDSI